MKISNFIENRLSIIDLILNKQLNKSQIGDGKLKMLS